MQRRLLRFSLPDRVQPPALALCLCSLPLPLRRTPYPGGAPANVATGVARLGAGSLFISAIGQDELGDQFLALLKGGLR